MAEASRAVGSTYMQNGVRPLKTDHDVLWDGIEELHEGQKKLEGKVDSLIEVIGKPGTADGGQPASGIFAHLNAHDRRIKKFEVLWHQAVGFGCAAAPLLIALWWLAGDKIAKLLHG